MSEWIIIDPAPRNRLVCLRCGKTYALRFPLEIWEMSALSKGFTAEHRKCAEPADGLRCRSCLQPGHAFEACAALNVATPEQWLAGPDTGTSSRTICAALHHPSALAGWHGSGVPHDFGDFGRCSRLLALFPHWRARLGEVAARYPDWAPLVAHWDELEALYAEDLEASKTRPQSPSKVYQRIRQLRGERS